MGCITEMTKLVILILLKRDIESLDIKKDTCVCVSLLVKVTESAIRHFIIKVNL